MSTRISSNYFFLLIGFLIGFLAAIYCNLNISLSKLIEKTSETKSKLSINDKSIELNIQNCNDLYHSVQDELSIFHPDIRNKKVSLYKNKEILVDDILYGYDILFERNFLFATSSWLGVQNQQDPSDAHLLQEIIWKLKPDLIIDLGTNTGGSALFFASIMNYYNNFGKIVSVDIKNFDQNWIPGKCEDCINPMNTKLWKNYVTFYQGSTTDSNIVSKIREHAQNATCVFVSQDASHDPYQVYTDIKTYSEFVTLGSYILVQDSKLDRFNKRHSNGIHHFTDKFLKENDKFIMDRSKELRFFYTQHAKGYLKRIK